MFKEELIPILQITSRKEKMTKPFSIHFVKQMLPWYQDQTKIIKKKKKKILQNNISHEHGHKN